MPTWYYAENDTQRGPVSDDDLAALVQAGRIQASTLVWNEQLTTWQPYASARAMLVQRRAEALATGVPEGTASTEPTPLRAAPVPESRAALPSADGAEVCMACGMAVPSGELEQVGAQWLCLGCKAVRQMAWSDASAMAYAGFWIRVAAKLVDGLILVVGNVLGGLAMAGATATLSSADGGSPIVTKLTGSGLQFLLSLAYTAVFLGRFGATPGKMLCGLRVVRSDGSRISYGRALARHFADMLSGLTLCIGYLMVAFDDERRALHDHLCDTRVCHT